MKRGAVKKKDSRPIITWFPTPLLEGMDRAVAVADLDRSKFVRAAVREKISREAAR
jgi:metal-responsive CopG/Arc/MetJ family transcriptional regulator